MWYWNDNNLEGLLAVAESIADDPTLQDFAQYCHYREQGLWQEAFRALAQFIAQVGRWPFPQRKRFVDWVLMIKFRQPHIHQLLPHPLIEGIIRPTLMEWSQVDPRDPVPLRWRGVFLSERQALEEAVVLAPREEIARIVLIDRLIGDIEYATHHLPDYFIGEPRDCFPWAEQARVLLEPLHQHPEYLRLHRELHQAVALVEDWITFQSTGTGDFAAWCAQHGRKYHWTKVYYYVD